MAYSTDGLKTIKKYSKNPVIENIVGENRDPKVVWCEELNTYIMSLYLEADVFVLFSSKDLLEWRELQRVTIPNEYECPGFFPLTATDGKRKWVFMGARDVYLIGEFQKGKFQATQEVKRMNGVTAWYAAQSYTDMPDGRTIRIPWLGTAQAKTFSAQMGTPCELRIENFDGEYYLSFQPVKEISSIVSNRKTYKNVFLAKPQKIDLEDRAVSLKLKGEWKKEGIVKLIFFGVEILFNFSKNEIVVGDAVNALSLQQKNLDVHILADRSAMEFYCDGGKIAFALSHQAICDANLPYVEISSNCDYSLEDLTIEEYECTWEQNQ
jgi:sucrose-6-phosphate hydrolase SacC (GH32 family)